MLDNFFNLYIQNFTNNKDLQVNEVLNKFDIKQDQFEIIYISNDSKLYRLQNDFNLSEVVDFKFINPASTEIVFIYHKHHISNEDIEKLFPVFDGLQTINIRIPGGTL